VTVAVLGGTAVLFAVALAVGLRDWRWSVVGLLAYIPVSGIPIDAAYGHRLERAVAVLGKDFLFVIPAYVGFAVWAWRRRERIVFPGAPVTLVVSLAAIVVVQSLNPNLPKPLVGLIGLKVWLFYVPLFLLGYHLVRTRTELHRLLGLVALLALVPAVVGLVEALFIYGGRQNDVYRLYGDAAAAVTQEYVGLELPGGGHLRRIPSTFSSFYQYYLFLATALALGYAWWRGGRLSLRASVLAAVAWLVVLVASFLTGVRAAFFMTPLLLVLVLALSGRSAARSGIRWLLPAAVVLGVVSAIPGTYPVALWSNVADVARQEFWDVIVDSGRDALSLTVFGLGSGIDSIASRYAFPNDAAWREAIFPLLGRWHESWYVKAWIELGAVGTAVVLALFGTILVRAVRLRRSLRSRGLLVAWAALFGVIVWSLVYAVKGQYLDLDPLNVYFWLFAGLLFKLPALEESEPLEPEPEPAQRRRPVADAVSP
jgi:hypothetical protein